MSTSICAAIVGIHGGSQAELTTKVAQVSVAARKADCQDHAAGSVTVWPVTTTCGSYRNAWHIHRLWTRALRKLAGLRSSAASTASQGLPALESGARADAVASGADRFICIAIGIVELATFIAGEYDIILQARRSPRRIRIQKDCCMPQYCQDRVWAMPFPNIFAIL